MATLMDNISEMAQAIADLKKKYRLTENTILRVIDMNLALQQQSRNYAQQMPPSEDMIPLPEDDAALAAMLGIEQPQADATEETTEETTEEETTND